MSELASGGTRYIFEGNCEQGRVGHVLSDRG